MKRFLDVVLELGEGLPVLRDLKDSWKGKIKGLLVLRGGFACCIFLLATLSCQDFSPRPKPYVSGVSDAEMYLPVEKDSMGPIPPQLKGDTVTVYMEMFWDAGNASILKDHYREKFIIE